MKKILFVCILLLALSVEAQHSISGTFSPAKEYSWIIAYRLKPGTQVYAVDTAIKNGEFSLNLPESSPPGTYRLVYAVPQEEFYFDVIYNGKEDVTLSFNNERGVAFTSSQENILFGTYFNEINTIERDIISFYSNGSTDVKEYRKNLRKYQMTQELFEKKSKDLLANQFIKANRSIMPSDFESINHYVKNRKNFYFENLDVANPTLQASGFLTDKLTNYVFTALPLEPLEKAETEKEMQLNVSKVFDQLEGVSETYRFHILYTLWAQSSGRGFNVTADFIHNRYLKNSALAEANKDIIDKIEIYNRLRIGVEAPEIVWKKDKGEQKLSSIEGAENYILIFWSSTCGHCLRELPALHNKLKGKENIKVVAVGLEDDDLSWNIESAKLEGFEHAISLGKWQSEYAKAYDIHATPSYFILDSDKKIIAKPDNDKGVVEFLENKD